MKKLLHSFLQKKNVFEVLQPFFVVLKIYGLTPFDLGNVAMNDNRYLGKIFIALNFGFSLYWSQLMLSDPYVTEISKVLDIGLYIMQVSPGIVVLLFFIISLCQRRNHHQIYQKLHHFDKKVKKFNFGQFGLLDFGNFRLKSSSI